LLIAIPYIRVRATQIVRMQRLGRNPSCGFSKLPLAACRQKRRVRFVTAAALVNELVEAKQNNHVRRMMARWQKYELIGIDEVGYVPLADVGAEFLFQVISDRAERAAEETAASCLPFWGAKRSQ